jgi:hypothetical protein
VWCNIRKAREGEAAGMRLSMLSVRVFFIFSWMSFLILITNACLKNSVQCNVGVSRGLVLEGFLGVGKSSPGFDVRLQPGPVNKRVEALSISSVPWLAFARAATTITS